MLSAPVQKLCATANQSCIDYCPGYGSRATCPPLIVLAVVSSMPLMPVRQLSEERDDLVGSAA
jgi:hypothetical protein